jgi:hypothetical protein
MNVEMRYCLPRCGAIIDADVVSVWLVFGVDIALRIIEQRQNGRPLLGGQIKPRADMPPRNN